jgi:hypothetical protein
LQAPLPLQTSPLGHGFTGSFCPAAMLVHVPSDPVAPHVWHWLHVVSQHVPPKQMPVPTLGASQSAAVEQVPPRM